MNRVRFSIGFSLYVVGVLLSQSFPAYAASDVSKQAAVTSKSVKKGERSAEAQTNPPVIAQPDVDKYQQKTQDVYEQMKEISKGLSPSEQKHFYMIYNNYNLVGTVKMVQRDVGRAIDACSAANPDMENALRGRYQSWDEAVEPVVRDASAHIDNMVAAQSYTSPKTIRSLFKAVDETRAFTDKQAEKKPVTSPEACHFLTDKMGDTQANLVRMMKATLMSVPPETVPPVPHVPAPVDAPGANP